MAYLIITMHIAIKNNKLINILIHDAFRDFVYNALRNAKSPIIPNTIKILIVVIVCLYILVQPFFSFRLAYQIRKYKVRDYQVYFLWLYQTNQLPQRMAF